MVVVGCAASKDNDARHGSNVTPTPLQFLHGRHCGRKGVMGQSPICSRSPSIVEYSSLLDSPAILEQFLDVLVRYLVVKVGDQPAGKGLGFREP